MKFFNLTYKLFGQEAASLITFKKAIKGIHIGISGK
jgi:hypothetical protein